MAVYFFIFIYFFGNRELAAIGLKNAREDSEWRIFCSSERKKKNPDIIEYGGWENVSVNL